MKKIYVLVLLVSGIAFGQPPQDETKYITTISNLNYRINKGVKRTSNDSEIKIVLTFESGAPLTVYQRRIAREGDSETNRSFGPIRTKEKPVSIACSAFVNFRTGSDAGATYTRDINIKCPNDHFDGDYSPRMSHITFDYKVEPQLKVIAPGANNALPTDDLIEIKSDASFDSYYYNWQYGLNVVSSPSPNWIDLPQYYGQRTISTNAKAILGANAGAYHGQKITFRLKPCGTDVAGVADYIIRQSAPKIISAVPTPVSCYDLDKKDGALQLTFDRNLLPNETLGFDTNPDSGDRYNITISNDRTYTITGLSRGTYTLKLIGSINGTPTFSSTVDNPISFSIGSPKPVSFSTSKTDIRCYNISDGTITLNAWDGTEKGYQYSKDNGSTWFYFNNTENPGYNPSSITFTNLNIGTRTFKVKDSNNCIAKEQVIVDGKIELKEEKEIPVTITQPAAPVIIDTIYSKEPTFFGATNGQLVAVIRGGTAYPDGSYTYEWVNEAGTSQNLKTTTFYNTKDTIYNITLAGIPAGRYYLTVKDKNFNDTKENYNCTVTRSEYQLKQPDKLKVTFEMKNSISCNVANTFGNEVDNNPYDGQRDESQDGVLVAHVTGGVAFKSGNKGLPYKYFWKKQQADGSWAPWVDENDDETAQYLSDGQYALNIEDANGIVLGTYDTIKNELIDKQDSIQYIQQPDTLKLAFAKGDISCSSGKNGWAEANVTGGTLPYTYQWTNGATAQKITDLITNNYFVKIIDAKGCRSEGSIAVVQPDGVAAHEIIDHPNCFQGSDGSITLMPTGGVMPYSYLWNTGSTSAALSGLVAGDYSVTITDAQDCKNIREFILTDPEPIVIDLGPDRTLCNAQSLDADSSIADPKAQYLWTSTNGFTADTALVNLTAAGTYNVKVTSELGCTGEDEIEIKTSTVAIDSEFFLSSQAYLDEEVILVNASNPFGENTQWMIPDDVTIVAQQDDYITLKFNRTGYHTIALKQTQGECYAMYSKNINVETRNITRNTAGTSFITDFIVTPNPSDGNFKAVINLESESPIDLRLFSTKGEYTSVRKTAAGQKNYIIDFNTQLAAGMYVLVLETPKQTLVKKIIIY